MEFYVIYSFDCKRSDSVKRYQPPKLHKWQCTEDDDCYEFDYLADETHDNDYRNGKHRKYTAILSKDDFIEFIDHCDLTAQEVETMGSLTEYGHMPAISFDGYYDYDWEPINQCAYVTPLPFSWFTGEPIKEQTECNWYRIRQAVLNQFGN